MLYRSDDNLEKGAISFVEDNNEVTLFSAYLKLDALKKINQHKSIKQIIVRWEIEDLYKKISDLELYDYCLENNIALYRNTRIHLKAFWNNNKTVLFGSANITGKGIGEKGNFNYELNGVVSDISFGDQSYLNKIILDSEYVTHDLFTQLKSIISKIEVPVYEFLKLPTPPPTVDYFLINQLPMSSSVELLYDIYRESKSIDLEINCAAHDLQLYKIKSGLNRDDFMIQLKSNFNNHPFIVKFKQTVKNSIDNRGRSERNGRMLFGSVRKWFSENTTTVPTPRPYELNEYIKILYNWICLFDDNYTWDVPGSRSEVIYYKSVKQNS